MHYNPFKDLVLRIAVGVILFSFFSSSDLMAGTPAVPEKKEILVIGSGAVNEGNVADAKEKAIKDALTKGLERHLVSKLGAQGMLDHFPAIVRDILPKAQESIENFHILAESQSEKKYSILVRIKINEKVMEETFKEIGRTLNDIPPLKILFLVSHMDPKSTHPRYWWGDPGSNPPLNPSELALIREFEENGYSPVNRGFRIPETNISDDMKVLDLSNREAIRWGSLLSADLVLYGKCEMDETGSVILDLTAVDPKSEIMVARDRWFEKSAKMPDDPGQEMELLRKVARQAVGGFSPKILSNMELGEKDLVHVEIAISGLGSFRQFRALKEFFEKEIAGVKSVVQSGIRERIFLVMIEFRGTMDRFIERIAGHERSPVPFDMTRSEEGKLLVHVRPQP